MANPLKWIKLGVAGVVLAALAFAAVYLYGQGKSAGINQGNKNIAEYERKVTDLNNQLLRKEVEVRTEVIRTYHTREIVRTKVEYKNQNTIRTVVPEQFLVSKGWEYAHDQSAKGEEIKPELAADPSPSDTTDKKALEVVSSNYDLANRNADRLEALQDYINKMGLADEK